MEPLMILAGVVWGVAIKRIVNYSQYKSRLRKGSNDKTLDGDSSLEEDERTLYLIAEGARRREEERRKSQRPIIIIKDSIVYPVKGDDDEY